MIINNMFIDFCAHEFVDNKFDLDLIKSDCLSYIEKYDNTGNIFSNRGGYQSKNINFNIISAEYKNLCALFDYSITAVNSLNNSKEFKLEIGNAWININNSSDHNIVHAHPNSIFSGVIYIDVPKEGNPGNIVFHRERSFSDYMLDKFITQDGYGYTSYFITPKNGLFLAFPANIQHHVEPHFSDFSRMSIAINYQPSLSY